MIFRREMKQKRRGAVAVEMAVVTPVLLAMLFGIIEFGWMFTAQHTMVNAAREGARYGALQGTTSTEIVARVQQFLQPMGLDGDVTINVTEATVADPIVTVQVTAPRDQISLVGNFFGFQGGTVEGTASMRKEGM